MASSGYQSNLAAHDLELRAGSVVQFIRKCVPLLVTVFVSSIHWTHVFNIALESKGFGARPEKHTFFLQTARGRRGVLVLVAFAVLLAGSAAL